MISPLNMIYFKIIITRQSSTPPGVVVFRDNLLCRGGSQIVFFELSAEHLQGRKGKDALVHGPVLKGQMQSSGDKVAGTGQTDADGAHRFFIRSARRPGDAA